MKRAFSLVELSIVLVILGLLTGGILAGQSLIRASELRAVSTEYNRYITAMQSFRDKYFALPGDMTNATSFWGDQAAGTAACASAATADGTPGTCNGDGDGIIGPTGSGTGAEGLRAWQQLANAGLMEGSYLGYLDAGGTKLTLGVNVPRSKLSGAGWTLIHRSTAVGNPIWGVSTQFIQFGAEGSNNLWGGILVPEEVWNIDTKMDDGLPETGSVMVDGIANTCVTPNAFASVAAAGRAYNLSSTNKTCMLFIRMGR